jgi:hypothetical protein
MLDDLARGVHRAVAVEVPLVFDYLAVTICGRRSIKDNSLADFRLRRREREVGYGAKSTGRGTSYAPKSTVTVWPVCTVTVWVSGVVGSYRLGSVVRSSVTV